MDEKNKNKIRVSIWFGYIQLLQGGLELSPKYQSLEDAKDVVGEVASISSLFIEFQKHLYEQKVA